MGYDPTLPAQHNLGSAKPYKQPADGEELDEPDGSFSGQTLYVPGPYKMPGQSIGSDSPPTAKGVFNDNQTYTGCAVDRAGNVFGSDIATAQGDYPPPSSGRLVEWFAPTYTTYCIVYGPDGRRLRPHHTDGTGGLAQPGTMALADNGDLLVPNVGTSSVLRFAHSSLPASAAGLSRAGSYPRSQVQVSTFVANQPFAAGVAKDPTCDCFAVSSYIGNPAIRWVSDDGQPVAGRAPVPGTTVADLGKDPAEYNPFGLAFAPDGTLYFVDIHIACTGTLTNCGPGRLRRPGHEGHLRPTASRRRRSPSPPASTSRPASPCASRPSRCARTRPVGSSLPCSGPSENPAPDKRAALERPGHGRLRLTRPRPPREVEPPVDAASARAALADRGGPGGAGRRAAVGLGQPRAGHDGRPRPQLTADTRPAPGTGPATATTPSTPSPAAPR